MSLFSWVRRKLSLTDGSYWATFFGGESWSGKHVTPQGALNLSAWWRCTMLYAHATGSLPIKFYLRGTNDDRTQDFDHEVAQAIADPNLDQTNWEYWAGQGASLAMLGNAISEKLYVGERLVGLQPLLNARPQRKDGVLSYTFSDRGKVEELPRDKIFHIRGVSIPGINPDTDLGLSPLAAARQTLGITMATEQAVGSTFAQGMRASGIFSSTTPLTPEQAKQFKDNYVKPVEGSQNEGKSLVLPPSFKWQQVSIPPKDVEMLLSRRFNVEDVCRWQGVPPILVGHAAEGQTMWGSGVESILLAWLTLGLDAHLCMIERAINKWLLKPADRIKYYAEFDRNGLMRADSTARAEFISKMISNAQMTPNEGRKKDNRPPMPGGDELYMNSTNTPLRLVGQQKPATAAPPAA